MEDAALKVALDSIKPDATSASTPSACQLIEPAWSATAANTGKMEDAQVASKDTPWIKILCVKVQMNTAKVTTKIEPPASPASKDTESTREEDASTLTNTAPTSISQDYASTVTDSTSSTTTENVSSGILNVLFTQTVSAPSADPTTSQEKASACPTWQVAKFKKATKIVRPVRKVTTVKVEIVWQK